MTTTFNPKDNNIHMHTAPARLPTTLAKSHNWGQVSVGVKRRGMLSSMSIPPLHDQMLCLLAESSGEEGSFGRAGPFQECLCPHSGESTTVLSVCIYYCCVYMN